MELISYKADFKPGVEELVELFDHADYFPVKDRKDFNRIKRMFDNANIVITAWQDETIGRVIKINLRL